MLRTRMGVAAALLAATLSAAACRADSGPEPIPLDGTARPADVAGVVASVSRDRITIGSRRFAVADELQAFTTATLQPVPILSRRGHYVHAGIHDGEVVWLAAFSPPVELPGAAPSVFYVGRVRSASRTRIAFVDGTVLEKSADLTAPPRGHRARMAIDPGSARIRSVEDLGVSASR